MDKVNVGVIGLGQRGSGLSDTRNAKGMRTQPGGSMALPGNMILR